MKPHRGSSTRASPLTFDAVLVVGAGGDRRPSERRRLPLVAVVTVRDHVARDHRLYDPTVTPDDVVSADHHYAARQFLSLGRRRYRPGQYPRTAE